LYRRIVNVLGAEDDGAHLHDLQPRIPSFLLPI
jgi:hypothetical protein